MLILLHVFLSIEPKVHLHHPLSSDSSTEGRTRRKEKHEREQGDGEAVLMNANGEHIQNALIRQRRKYAPFCLKRQAQREKSSFHLSDIFGM